MRTGIDGRHGRAESLGWLAHIAGGLPPSCFAFVMATGIISTGMLMIGWVWLSRVLLVVVCTGMAALGLALVTR